METFLKMRVSEICVERICVNQGLGVPLRSFRSILFYKQETGTVNSRFSKVNFSILKLRVVWLKTSRPKKMPYLGGFASWDLS